MEGALPYRLTFDMRVRRVEPPHVLEGRASGAIEGDGCWSFVADGARTIVRYDWHIRTHVRWMNWLEPLGRPLFRWNHDVVMREGAKGRAAAGRDGRDGGPDLPAVVGGGLRRCLNAGERD